ncbi:MAG: hypothetical protein R2864_03325 [Syntrophotaleaceae bacterium]
MRFSARPWLSHFKDQILQQVSPQTPLEVPLTTGGSVELPLAQLAGEISAIERGMKIVKDGCRADRGQPAANRRSGCRGPSAGH